MDGIQLPYDIKKFQHRIEICGGIASGKTTLTQLLEKNGFCVAYEDYEANPYIKDFYTNSSINCDFETEMVFTLLHFSSIKRSRKATFDFSLLQDLAYANANLTEYYLKIYYEFYKGIMKSVGFPKYLIYIECSPKTALQRLKRRNRLIEEEVQLGYLMRIINELKKIVVKYPNVLILDSEKVDFLAENKKIVNIVRQYIEDKNTELGEVV